MLDVFTVRVEPILNSPLIVGVPFGLELTWNTLSSSLGMTEPILPIKVAFR